MTCCIFDNPNTWRREAWQDGKLIADIAAVTMMQVGFDGNRNMPFMLNVGREFIPGNLAGDIEAIAIDSRSAACKTT